MPSAKHVIAEMRSPRSDDQATWRGRRSPSAIGCNRRIGEERGRRRRPRRSTRPRPLQGSRRQRRAARKDLAARRVQRCTARAARHVDAEVPIGMMTVGQEPPARLHDCPPVQWGKSAAGILRPWPTAATAPLDGSACAARCSRGTAASARSTPLPRRREHGAPRPPELPVPRAALESRDLQAACTPCHHGGGAQVQADNRRRRIAQLDRARQRHGCSAGRPAPPIPQSAWR
jgi:hypothetical protein